MPPPCEQCHPGIIPENAEAWEIFQLASSDDWGISPGDVLTLCRVAKVEDEVECLIKVLALKQFLSSDQAPTKSPTKTNSGWYGGK